MKGASSARATVYQTKRWRWFFLAAGCKSAQQAWLLKPIVATKCPIQLAAEQTNLQTLTLEQTDDPESGLILPYSAGHQESTKYPRLLQFFFQS